MNAEGRAELRRLADAADPGPWKHWPAAGEVEVYSEAPSPSGPSSVDMIGAL